MNWKQLEADLIEALENSTHMNVYEENEVYIVLTDYKKTIKSIIKNLKGKHD